MLHCFPICPPVMLQAVKDQRGNTWHVTAINRRGIITVEGLSKSFARKAHLHCTAMLSTYGRASAPFGTHIRGIHSSEWPHTN